MGDVAWSLERQATPRQADRFPEQVARSDERTIALSISVNATPKEGAARSRRRAVLPSQRRHDGTVREVETVLMYFLLFYEVVDDYVERRQAFRAEHLALAQKAKERGELILAGAYADPPDGAALVFRGDDDSIVRAFIALDPYVREGLVTKWVIRQWTVVVGDQ